MRAAERVSLHPPPERQSLLVQNLTLTCCWCKPKLYLGRSLPPAHGCGVKSYHKNSRDANHFHANIHSASHSRTMSKGCARLGIMCSCLRRVLVGAPRWVLGLCSDTLLDQRTSHTSASRVPHAPNIFSKGVEARGYRWLARPKLIPRQTLQPCNP